MKNQVLRQEKSWKNQFFFCQDNIFAGKTGTAPVEDAAAAPLLLLFSNTLQTDTPVLFAAPTYAAAEAVQREFICWSQTCGKEYRTLLLPDGPFNGQAAACSDSPRAKCLDSLLHDPPQILFASAPGMLAPVPQIRLFQKQILILRPGMTLSPSELAEKLVRMDYDDEAEVTVAGEFARRGGIFDVFSPAAELPVRIEYFGDEIESIRSFHAEDQRTCGTVSEYRIIPRSGNQSAVNADETPAGEPFDYFSSGMKDAKLVILHPDDVKLQLQRFAGTELEHWDSFLEKYRSKQDLFLFAEETEALENAGSWMQPPFFALHKMLMNTLPEGVEYGFSELARELIGSLIKRWIQEGTLVRLLWRSEQDRDNMLQWLQEAQLEPGKLLQLEQGKIPCGLFQPEKHQVLLTEQELFATPLRMRSGHPPLPNLNEKKADDAPASISQDDRKNDLSVFADLNEGDYAVHLNHGICIYRGLRTIRTDDREAEMLALEFADEAMMYIPIWQAHYIARYIGSKKAGVTLNSINSKKWGKTRAEASNAVRNLAYEMLKMQALRSSIHGTPFPGDDLNQRMFEQAFPFQETNDQLRSAAEIKHDMESEKPMDRLLCGDVGYGKTEVAMRAACKCVLAGKQVAVLVPTTVLAQQHYYSFLERFAGMPVIIEQLSRFRTAKEQRKIIQRMKEGTVDIVIGTHRLVQDDIGFKNLGLVIIDEEQRFGVLHKEKLKKMRACVDVLTMTATPIPRTLYLSMSGMRDLSTIMSAPVQRLPVQTIITQESPDVIRNAVARELQRGGQVFYLHNRVASIDDCALNLQAMFPRAKIGTGHGKMSEEELENVMSSFIEGKTDILVCTTIIESGLDIPNANTIIIERADRFGLAELYQLRGRVGRWHRQAYAYMLLPKSMLLTGDARKRIAAMRRYTHLGAGFNLAMSDLQIRGAGNILGEEQSGQINAIGFYLYCDLLKSCIDQLNGQPQEPRPEVDLRLDFLQYAQVAANGKLAACFPPDWINAPELRLEAYRKLAVLGSEQTLDAFTEELKDRYGAIPKQAQYMLAASRIRILAAAKKINTVSVYDGKLFMEQNGSILKPHGMVPRMPDSMTPAGKLSRVLELIRSV